MGLRGPLPTSHHVKALRGNPDHRPAGKVTLPAEILADAKSIYRRLKSFGDHYATIAEENIAAKTKRPSPALWAAVKCWKEALQLAYRIGGFADEPDETERDPHDELEARRRARAKVP